MISLHTLREAAAGVWCMLVAWAGDPSEIARQGFASRRIARLMRDWVGNLEKLVRRIVYLAALELEPPAPAPARSGGARTPRTFPPRRSPFRLLYSWREPKPRSGFRFRPHDDPDDQWAPVRIGRYARRIEALRHAIWHTRPHALRLARALARLEAAQKPLPQVACWMIPSRLLTSGQGQVDAHITAITPLIARALRKRAPGGRPEEPG